MNFNKYILFSEKIIIFLSLNTNKKWLDITILFKFKVNIFLNDPDSIKQYLINTLFSNLKIYKLKFCS